MTDKVIIFERNGSISILWPSDPYPVEEVAKKDVPVGTPYIIIDAAELPKDPTFRAAWIVDFSSPTGYGQGYSTVIDNMVKEKMGTPPTVPKINEKDIPWPMA